MRTTRKQNKHNKHRKIFYFTAAALFAAVLGTWLLLAPYREREYVAAAQEAMMDEVMHYIDEAERRQTDIEGADGLFALEETEESAETNVTNGDYGFDYENSISYAAPEAITTSTRTPIFTDPIPENAFPTAITGIGILTIEAIDLRLPIADDIEYATLRIAPGRVPQTAQIGDIGNAVIAGHRNYAFGSMFNRLGELETGDILQYQARNGEVMEFVVFEIAIIEPENQIAFLQPTNESIITLYTCTPIRTATHRLIIRAERVN